MNHALRLAYAKRSMNLAHERRNSEIRAALAAGMMPGVVARIVGLSPDTIRRFQRDEHYAPAKNAGRQPKERA